MQVENTGMMNGLNVLQNMLTELKGCDTNQDVAGISIRNKMQQGALKPGGNKTVEYEEGMEAVQRKPEQITPKLKQEKKGRLSI